MSLSILLLLTLALFAPMVMVVFAFGGPSAGKAQSRRLLAIRERHVGGSEEMLAVQMRKTINKRTNQKNSRIANYMPNRKLLENRLKRTGKNWQIGKFMWTNVGIVTMLTLLLAVQGMPLFFSLAVGSLIGIGLPHMAVNFLIAKRTRKFTETFPDAIDLMVRGLKSGLPISETLGIVAKEVDGPVGEEFKSVNERIRIGKTMDAALQETADKIGTPEFQFFVITLAIQRETGGNLAETLGNLSEVLRKRAQMKLKIKAMSSEAKASAYIVGALPFFVFGIVYMTNPAYLAGFFHEERLIITGLGGLVWMGIGIFIMKKMISFKI
ncbi:type II secretion system F family protein [Sphingorhabdus soli]|uniref:Type II secretion system F family protein n=1 Tax=Flavisphingopyxis soli TaxID=2601267 RepID=A0A5C6U756_9SPHN|nr:type II secretion system F family protein [Sphingorhabdus soli]TXC68702.1 type II secretion system F family protein [Sphingorhabdus soli]